jgi:hypothetical protein
VISAKSRARLQLVNTLRGSDTQDARKLLDNRVSVQTVGRDLASLVDKGNPPALSLTARAPA